MEKSVSIVATFTADFIDESLSFLSRELGNPLEVSFAPYGQVFQQLLEPQSEFIKRRSGWNMLLLRVDDLLGLEISINQEVVAEIETKLQQRSQEFCDAVIAYSRLGVAPLLVVITPSKETHYRRLTDKFASSLIDKIGDLSSVHLVTSNQITDLYPVESVFEDESERFGHVPYTETYFAALASFTLRYLTMATRPEKKVLVLDCDNTLWKGVCGEDGDQGVAIEAGHRFLQTFALQQLDMGRLICLVSKNAESDVKSVFENNSQMLIPWKKLSATKINWQPKSDNLRALATDLKLGLDSFVFLDDNPLEIAEVVANCPQVLAIQIPEDDGEIPQLLRHIWVFDKYRVTEDDRKRANSYRDNIKRQQLQNATSSFADFLEKLELQVGFETLSPTNQARAAQLSQRTNQFNTTTRRHDELSLRKLINASNTACHTVQVKDKFGDYGLVGVVMTEATNNRLIVTDFMLSCRALGRGVEHKMLAYVGALAGNLGLAEVDVKFVPTERNSPVLLFLDSLDFGKSGYGDVNHYRFATESLHKLGKELPVYGNSKTEVEDTDKSNRGSLPDKNSNKPQGGHVESDRQILEVGRLCSNPSNVIRVLSSEVRERPSLQQPFSKPKEGLEVSLARIWQRVLRLRNVGRSDRFTDLGGNSIQLVKIHTLILEELGFDVPITALFKYASVSALAEHLQFSGSKDNRMVAARERAIRSRAAAKANFRKFPRRSNG